MLSRLLDMSNLVAFILFAFFTAVFSIIFYAVAPPFMNDFDLKARDAFFRFRGNSTPPTEVVIVAVDEQSVNELGRFPWKRKKFAALIDNLHPAKVVAFDMVFSETEDDENDRSLANSIKAAGNVVLGYFFRDDSTEIPDKESLVHLERSKVGIVRHLDLSENSYPLDASIVRFKGVEPNIASVGANTVGFGSFNILPDIDGLYRTANLIYLHEDNIFTTLSIEALRRYYDEELVLTMAPYGVDNIAVGERIAPLNESGGFSLNFYGPGGTFKTYSAADVILGRVDSEVFRDKIVFVGVTEKAIYDIRNTPVDTLYPGVEVHATVAGNILEERYLIHDATVIFLNVLMILALPLILALLISRVHHTYLSLAIFGALFIGAVVFTYYLFSTHSLVVSTIYPIFSLSVTYLALEAYRNLVVERKSRYMKKAFSSYVSPHIVEEIGRNPDSLVLGGAKRDVTILFSDIRGFTSISEALDAEDLVTLLNEYLSPMTDIVLSDEGTLDKYIGDAVMAIYNAPLDIGNHAIHACRSCLKMMKALPALNDKWETEGYPRLDIGIGLNSGEAVVGNMGGEKKFDYTAMGDTVNLASRLEGMNKMYGTHILVSEETHDRAIEQFIFRKIDFVKVKGKDKPVVIFELVDFAAHGDPVKTKLASQFEEGIMNYRKGKFKTAKAVFEEVLKTHPEDMPARMYVKRCDDYTKNPPPPDWDGAYVATSK